MVQAVQKAFAKCGHVTIGKETCHDLLDFEDVVE